MLGIRLALSTALEKMLTPAERNSRYDSPFAVPASATMGKQVTPTGTTHMRVVRLKIRNFRGIASCELHFDGTTVLLGDNNIGKSTVLEAIELAIGPDRLSRKQPIDEHDFHGGRYRGPDGGAVSIAIEVVVAGLAPDQVSKFRENVEWWRAADRVLVGPGEIADVGKAGIEPALRIEFVGQYDPDGDEFTAKTWFASPRSLEDVAQVECRAKDKREFGFLHLRAIRTGNRALSMERGSLLDVILRLYDVRAQMWEGLLSKLRTLDVVGENDAEFGKILSAIDKAMRELVPGEWADAPHLRVSELTREDLRHVLKSFLATGLVGYAAPFQHQGSGTINTLVLAMLGLIAERRKGRVIFAMEEPELSLPPHVQKRVVDRVKSLASQSLFTSHSPYVMEEFSADQMCVLTRTEGILSGSGVGLPANLKPKAFREGVRTRFCEALLARRVIVAEGKAEVIGYTSAARRLQELEPDTFSRLDTLGWVVFDAGGDGNVAPYAYFFRALGKKVATIFDQQGADQRAAITAVCDFAFEQPHDGFERLITSEMPEVSQARFVRALEQQNDWPESIRSALPPPGAVDAAYVAALFTLLTHKKGDDFVPALFAQCAKGEFPKTMLSTLSALKTHAAPPFPPEAGKAPPGNGGSSPSDDDST
jgi:putative ATP-dependent endonuclease of the OLD family